MNELTNNHGSIFRHRIVIPSLPARRSYRKKKEIDVVKKTTATTLIKKRTPLTVKIDMNFI
jgi:hypothetical protein